VSAIRSPRLKDLARQEEREPRFLGGHSLCAGCGIPSVVRTILNSIEGPAVVVNATGCLEVATSRYPTTAWNVPWLHSAFENAAATMSGVETADRVLRRRSPAHAETPEPTFVVFAGDGGTYDIGLQSLSGALERGHRLMYVCYDNEAYMNTGIQRSSATPFAASTTTTPVGSRALGKVQSRKDLTAIAAAHRIPYVAQASISHLQDLARKARVAASVRGPSFLNVLSSCPLGWGTESRDSIAVARLGVESRYWPLFEIVDGRYRLNHVPLRPVPIERWLEAQTRFRHLARRPEVVAAIQAEVDREWQRLVALAAADATPDEAQAAGR
jgi:pyruvate ferredoxin oxidoreductase beta subunit